MLFIIRTERARRRKKSSAPTTKKMFISPKKYTQHEKKMKSQTKTFSRTLEEVNERSTNSKKTHEAHVKLNVTLAQLPFQMSLMNIHVNEKHKD
jgi:uncharacterized protein with von Willebrand factor type A (vWA) domain